VRIQAPDFRKRLDDLYMGPIGNRPDEFAAQLRREYALVARVVKSAGIRPE
jgi:tripartite-type tricarboxylate transporter receptor subunit TctC